MPSDEEALSNSFIEYSKSYVAAFLMIQLLSQELLILAETRKPAFIKLLE